MERREELKRREEVEKFGWINTTERRTEKDRKGDGVCKGNESKEGRKKTWVV